MVATWNHLSNISRGEERAFLPIEKWGRDEDYFWYSGGASFVDRAQDLVGGKAGDAWLAHLYIRDLGRGKPFVMGKYERVRLAMSMAEGYATGALGMGRYMNFRDPHGFDILARYTRFRHRHDDLFRAAEPAAETALLLPRQGAQNRRPEELDAFRALGQALLELPIALDILVDQRLTLETLARQRAVVLPATASLTPAQTAMLEAYAGAGTLFVWRDEAATDATNINGAVIIDAANAGEAARKIREHLKQSGIPVIQSPWTVRVAIYRQPKRHLLHLVNYDREPGAREDNRGSPADELPLDVHDISVEMLTARDELPVKVTLHAPDNDEPVGLDFRHADGQISFVIPGLRVYAIVAVDYSADD